MATRKLTKKSISRVIRYVMAEHQLKLMRGKRNGFVFNIREQIEWVDQRTGGKFDSRHYAPLVHEPIPDLRRGTIAYDDFWDMHDERCLYGYAPVVDGVEYPRITGPHYFYLNNYQILMILEGERKKRLHYPYYRALDHMIFLELEKAEKEGYGIIVGKARRMGLSYIGSVMLLWHMLFFPDNTVAVGAGKEDKAQALFDKMKKGIDNIRLEYRVSYRPTKEELVLAYKKTEHGVKKDAGILSSIDVKTFYSDVSAFEGGSYSFFIFEEIGIHDNLIKSYKASEPCFTEGSFQFGVPFLFGTGGEVDKGSKDFKIMFSSPESYNLKKLFIPKYMYYPGAPKPENYDELDELEKMDVGVNFFDVRTGLNDEQEALKHIMKRRMMARKSKEGYIKECQSYCIKESDIFLKTDGGLLNRLLLSAQREAIYNNEQTHTVVTGRYEWVDSDAIAYDLARCRNTKEKNVIRIRNNTRVQFIEDPDGTVQMLQGFKPINNDNMPYKADIIGIDSYDEEEVVESKSLGCSMVYRCFNGISNDYDLPIAVISERGDASSEDTFYDNCLKQSVYWNAESLIEYTKFAVLTYFKDVYAYEFLRENPNLDREVVTNRGRQTYGVRMTSGAKGIKRLVTDLLKMEVNENVHKICFESVVDELIEYGDKNTDIAMAYGVVLLHKADIFGSIAQDLDSEVIESDVLNMAYYTENEHGVMVPHLYDNGFKPDEMEVFDRRKHLTGVERENYLNFVAARDQKAKEEAERRQKVFLERSQDIHDPFASIRNEFIKQNNHNGD